MAELIVVRRMRRQYELRVSWILKDVSNPFELEERKFINKFRLTRAASWEVIEELRPNVFLGHYSYSLELYVLSTLYLLGSGSFQRVSGDSYFSQMSQPCLSKGMDKILKAFMDILPKYISFPVSAADLQSTKLNFMADLEFPNVIGAIDCSHINIKRPACDDWFSFLNRKRHFSVNVQMVCDSRRKILDVIARWPGSVHDSRIWQLSSLRRILENNTIPENNFLLGDKGYPLETWLLTPYRDPISPSEELFNYKHARARNVIERCFGVLKARFRVLDETGGIACYSPNKVCLMIIACAILHNICIKHSIEDPEVQLEDSDDDDDDDILYNLPRNGRARAIRDRIAMQFQQRR